MEREARGAIGTDAGGGTDRPDVLEMVYPQFGYQRLVPRREVDSRLVDRMREILAGDGYLWAGISVRLEPTRSGDDPGGFACGYHYEGRMLSLSMLCVEYAAADRFWRYASMFPPTVMWEKANEGRPPATRPVAAPWTAVIYTADITTLPERDRHLQKILAGVNPAIAWALLE